MSGKRSLGAEMALATALVLAGTGEIAAQTFDPINASLEEIIAAQFDGRTTCVQIAKAFQHRIASVDPKVKAFLTVNPDLIKDAEALDRGRASGARRPLHCVPVALKDNLNTAGMRTTGGSVQLKDVVPQVDSTAVKRLRDAGALFVGKTNLDELAVAGSTISSLGGQTLSPYDTGRFAAGSSGGSAVAVSTGMATVAVGTETVNSLRNAANVAGVVAIRPTRGLVSRHGVIPLSTTMDVVGTFARDVRDAAITLNVMVGRDVNDLHTNASDQFGHWRLGNITPAPLAGKRIGVLRNVFGAGPEHAEVNRVIAEALDKVKAAGAQIVDITDKEFDSSSSASRLNVNNYEFKPLFERYLAELGKATDIKTVKQYADANASPPTMTGYLRNAVTWQAPLEHNEYHMRLLDVSMFRAKIVKLFTDERLDAFAYPMQQRPSLKLTETPRAERNGIFASAIGFPAVNIPAGFTQPDTDAKVGTPIGIDLMGLQFKDVELLSLAAAIEKLLGARRAPQL